MTSNSQRPWANSTRRERLPNNWQTLRALTKARAGGHCQCPGCTRCQDQPCARPGSDADHITRGDNHTLANLAWLCRACHASKSAREGGTAPRSTEPRTTRRPTLRPPGLL